MTQFAARLAHLDRVIAMHDDLAEYGVGSEVRTRNARLADALRVEREELKASAGA